MMKKVGGEQGCGRTMWEYDPTLNRFGTTMSLMLLPYWTNGCVDSEEGLLFESASTTPFHFIDQDELSPNPSEAITSPAIDYTGLDVPLGIEHLQLLGVRYLLASSPTVEQAAAADPAATQVGQTGPWTTVYNGETLVTTWKVYRIADSPLVQPLTDQPVVWTGVSTSQASWLPPAVSWYDQPARWDVVPSAGGPSSWQRIPASDTTPTAVREPATKVTQVHVSGSSISFHVDRIGTPVEVRMSYFPNWQASGARRPVAGGTQPDGGGPDQSRRDAAVRDHLRRPPGPARHPGSGRRGDLAGGGRVAGAATGPVAGGAPRPGEVMAGLLGMFPLQTVLFPHAAIRLHVFEERYQALMADCLRSEGAFGVVLISRGSEVGGGDQRVDVGTVARIEQAAELGGGRLLVEAVGTDRVRVDRWLRDDPYPRAQVESVAESGDPEGALADAKLAVVRLRSLLSELRDVPPLSHDLSLDGDPVEVGWLLCSLAPLGPFDRQALLEATDAAERMTLLRAQCDAMAHDVSGLLAGETEA